MEKRQPYNSEFINGLYQHVLFYREKGFDQDYEVRLDNLSVVPRTNNPDLFFGYEACICEWSTELTILLYKGTSRVADKYIFVLKETSIEGGYSQAQVDALIERTKRDYQYGAEMKELRRKVKEQKKAIKYLRAALESKENDSSEQVTDLITTVSGIFNKESTTKVEEMPNSTPVNGISTAQLSSILEQYRLSLGEETFEALLGTSLTMAQQPQLIPPVRAFITQQQENES